LAPASSVRGSRGLTTRRSVTRAMGRQMAGRCPLQRGHLLGRQRQRGAESLGSSGSHGCCYRPNQRSEHRYQGSRPGAGQRMPGPRPPGSWRSSVGRYGRSEVNAKSAETLEGATATGADENRQPPSLPRAATSPSLPASCWPSAYLRATGGTTSAARSAAGTLFALIHRSAWNRYSRKFACRIVHTHAPTP
jgi:hypothetical protein